MGGREGLARRVPEAPSSLIPSTPLWGFQRKLPLPGHITQCRGSPCADLPFALPLLLCCVLMRVVACSHTRRCHGWAAPASEGTWGSGSRESLLEQTQKPETISPNPLFLCSLLLKFLLEEGVDTG